MQSLWIIKMHVVNQHSGYVKIGKHTMQTPMEKKHSWKTHIRLYGVFWLAILKFPEMEIYKGCLHLILSVDALDMGEIDADSWQIFMTNLHVPIQQYPEDTRIMVFEQCF